MEKYDESGEDNNESENGEVDLKFKDVAFLKSNHKPDEDTGHFGIAEAAIEKRDFSHLKSNEIVSPSLKNETHSSKSFPDIIQANKLIKHNSNPQIVNLILNISFIINSFIHEFMNLIFVRDWILKKKNWERFQKSKLK